MTVAGTDQLGHTPRQRVLATHLNVSVCAEDHQRAVAYLAGDKLQQQQGRGVGPVEIVEDQNERLRPGGTVQEGCDVIERAESRLLRSERGKHWEVRQQCADLRDELGDVGRSRTQLVA
jgi:hypothetical protein